MSAPMRHGLAAFVVCSLLAVLAFAGAPRLHPRISWADRWLVFVTMTSVSLLVLLPPAASVLLVEGHPYAPSFLLLSIAVQVLTRNDAGLPSTSMALLCLSTAIGMNASVALIPLSLAVLSLAGLPTRGIAVIVVATVGCRRHTRTF